MDSPTFLDEVMRKLFFATTCLCAMPVSAEEDSRGYSFFMALGQQHLNYKEESSILPVKTSVDIDNPLLITGALYAINDKFLVALDAAATFAADTTTEQWEATSSSFGGTPLTSSVLQENQFKLQQTDTRLLLHYRMKDQWFAITGPAFHTSTFKRFAFVPGPDNATNIVDSQVVEESASEILWLAGVALESEQLKNSRTHYSVRVYTAIPLWREVENTLIPTHAFDDTGGQDWALEARYSYAVHPKIHIGAWGQYIVSYRDSQKTCIAYAGANSGACEMNQAQAELPESRFRGLGYGIELLWKL